MALAFLSRSLKMQFMMSQIRGIIDRDPNGTFLLGSCFIAGMVLSIWVIQSWEYMPEWAPVPGPAIMDMVSCLRPIFLFLCGIPTAIAFLGGLVMNFRSLINRTQRRNILGILSFMLGLIILGSSTLPLFFQDQLEHGMQHYAISRYGVVIDAIEKYHVEHGSYPPSLNELVPNYLPAVPGKYMKFGEELNYFADPNSENARGYAGHGPFIFELTGMYAGIHGQTLKYCPIQDRSCDIFKGRVDDRWIWTYSTIL